MPNDALIRDLPESYVAYYERRGIAIDWNFAIGQHRKYAESLETAGLKFRELPPQLGESEQHGRAGECDPFPG